MHLRSLAVIGWLAAVAAPAAAPAAQPLHETVTPAFQHAIPNIPGKNLLSVVVDYPPGGKSGPHHHAGSAFIYAYVLSGAIRSQVDDGPDKVYRSGESFFETPGAQHRVSENASATEPARLLAVFIIDDGDTPLTSPLATTNSH